MLSDSDVGGYNGRYSVDICYRSFAIEYNGASSCCRRIRRWHRGGHNFRSSQKSADRTRLSKSCLEDFRLKLAELVLFTKWREQKTLQIYIGTHIVRFQSSLEYLGVTLDSKLSFKQLLELTGQKAATSVEGYLYRCIHTRHQCEFQR